MKMADIVGKVVKSADTPDAEPTGTIIVTSSTMPKRGNTTPRTELQLITAKENWAKFLMSSISGHTDRLELNKFISKAEVTLIQGIIKYAIKRIEHTQEARKITQASEYRPRTKRKSRAKT